MFASFVLLAQMPRFSCLLKRPRRFGLQPQRNRMEVRILSDASESERLPKFGKPIPPRTQVRGLGKNGLDRPQNHLPASLRHHRSLDI